MESQPLQSDKVDILFWTGHFGKWQLQAIVIVMVITQVPIVWPVFAGIFQAPPIHYWCARPRGFENWTVKEWQMLSSPLIKEGSRMIHDRCHIYNLPYSDIAQEFGNDSATPTNTSTVACTKWEYDRTEFTSTIITQWDLVCDRKRVTNLSNTLFMLGFLIGSFGGGLVSDKFGRKRAVLIFAVLLVLAGILAAFTPWYELFLILQLVMGATRIAAAMTAYTLVLELIGERSRARYGIIYNYFWALGYISVVGIAYCIRDWKVLQLVITGISMVIFPVYWLLPESPRWQLSTGRVTEAEQTVKVAMKKNGRPIPDSFKLAAPKKSDTKATILDLFRTWKIRKNTCLLCFIWCVSSMAYYGLTYGAGDLGGDIFLNVLLLATVEFPATTVAVIAVMKMGRKLPIFVCMLVTGSACLFTIVIPTGTYAYNWPVVTLAVIGKFGITASFATLWVYTLELYPTVVRTVGIGTNSMFARVGSIAAPFMKVLDEVYPHLLFTMFGLLSLVAGLFVLLLPETSKRRLPDSLEDGEMLGIGNKRPTLLPDREKMAAGQPINEHNHV